MRLLPRYFEKRVSSVEVTRFIFSKKHYKASQRRAKLAAFLPPPKYSELSVYQNGLQIEEMFRVGDKFVGAYRSPPRKVKACAVLDVCSVEGLEQNPRLKVLSWPKPHHLHANIKPFPIDKALRRHIAHMLSEIASVEFRA